MGPSDMTGTPELDIDHLRTWIAREDIGTEAVEAWTYLSRVKS